MGGGQPFRWRGSWGSQAGPGVLGQPALLVVSVEVLAGVVEPTRPRMKPPSQGMLSIGDFQTAGVVAYARGCPMGQLTAGRKQVLEGDG